MFIRLFKSNNPLSFILLPLFALVLWLAGFFSDQSASISSYMPLYEMVAKALYNSHFIATLIACLFVVSEGFLLNYIVNKYEILTKPSFLPALFYIVFMSIDNLILTIHPLLFANIFIMLAILKLVSSYQKENAFSNAFDTGIFFSISTLFYFPCIVLIPLLIIGFVLFRPFNWREWVISIMGLTLPYAFLFAYYFMNDTPDYWWNIKAFFLHSLEQPKLVVPASFYFILSIIALIIFFSFKKLFTGFYDASQKNKKGTILLLWFSILALISLFIAPQASIAIPIAVFCANYFLKLKKAWWGELLFFLLLISIFINHLFRIH